MYLEKFSLEETLRDTNIDYYNEEEDLQYLLTQKKKNHNIAKENLHLKTEIINLKQKYEEEIKNIVKENNKLKTENENMKQFSLRLDKIMNFDDEMRNNDKLHVIQEMKQKYEISLDSKDIQVNINNDSKIDNLESEIQEYRKLIQIIDTEKNSLIDKVVLQKEQMRKMKQQIKSLESTKTRNNKATSVSSDDPIKFEVHKSKKRVSQNVSDFLAEERNEYKHKQLQGYNQYLIQSHYFKDPTPATNTCRYCYSDLVSTLQ